MYKIFLLFIISAFTMTVHAEKIISAGTVESFVNEVNAGDSVSGGQNKQQDYKVTFIDNLNVTTYVSNVQYQYDYNDKTSPNNKFVISGLRGKSTVTIPWQKINRIDFVQERKNYNAIVSLKDGRTILIYAELSNSKYQGKNDFGGSFKINAEYVQAIIFN